MLVLEPKVLIADELSLGLAPIITDDLYDVLERILASGTALLLVEQHVDRALALANEVIVLERGIVRHRGHPRPGRDPPLGVRRERSRVVTADAALPDEMPVAVYRGVRRRRDRGRARCPLPGRARCSPR